MISVSNEFKALMAERTDFRETAEITLADVNGTVLELGSGDFTSTNNYLSDAAGQSSFPIGMAVEKMVQLELANWEIPEDDPTPHSPGERRFDRYDFFNARIHLSLSFDRPYMPPEIVNLGYYTVVTPEQYGDTVILTAVDDMWRADKQFALNLEASLTDSTSDPASLTDPTENTGTVYAREMLSAICTVCGIPAGTTVGNFRNCTFRVNASPDKDMTYRQAIGYIAMIAGGNARIDYNGQLQILEYNPIGETPQHTLNRFISMQSLSTGDVKITGVKWTVGNGENTVTHLAGTDDYAVTIQENPFAAGSEATLVNLLYSALGNLTFRPFEGEHTGYPIAEFMDTALITDIKGNTYTTFLTDISFVFAGKTTFKNSAESPQRNASRYTSAAATAAASVYQLVSAEKSSREAAIQNLAEQMAASSGLYMTPQTMPDGSTAFYLHDKPTKAESTVIWEMKAAGWRVSNNGGEDWTAGMTVDGRLIASILNTTGVNADWIRTGIITDQYNRNSWNLNTGELTITSGGVENLLYNSTGFTDTLDTNGNQIRTTSTDGWTKYGASGATLGAGKSTNTSFPGESRYYLSMYNPTSSVSYIDSEEFSLKPATKYTISGYIGYLGAGSGASGYIRIRDLDGSEYSPIQVLTLPSSATHGSFTRFSTTITTGQKTGYGYLRFRNLGADLSGSSNYNYLRINLIDIMVSEGSTEVPWTQSSKDLVKQTYNNLSITENKISSTMAATYLSQTDASSKYATKTSLTQTANSITSTVQEDYLKKEDAASEYATQNSMSSLTQTVDSISTTVSTKVGPNEIISKINQTAESIGIEASKIDLRGYTSIGGGYFTVDTNGKMTATDGTFSGAVTATSGKIGNWSISGNKLIGTSTDGKTQVQLSSVGTAPILCVKRNYQYTIDGSTYNDDWQDILVMRYTGAIESYTRNSSGTQTALFKVQDGNVTTSGNINCTGNFTATNGELTGKVTATSGKIGGFEITQTGTRLTGTSSTGLTRFWLSSQTSGDSDPAFRVQYRNQTSDSWTAPRKTFEINYKGQVFMRPYGALSSNYVPAVFNDSNWPPLYDGTSDPSVAGWVYYLSSSSERYKDIDRDMTAADVEKLYQIQPVIAKYKDGYLADVDENIGKYMPMFIAEDVEEYLPEAVTHRHGETEDWNYRVMIPVMFQMLKSQKETIDKQDKEIATLEARLAALEKKLEDLGL